MKKMSVQFENYEQKDIIRFLREATGKTQTEFANDIGKSRSWIAKIENGEINILFKDFLELTKKNNIKVTMTDNQKEENSMETTTITFRTTTDIKQTLDNIALDQNRTLSNMIETIVIQWLKTNKKNTLHISNFELKDLKGEKL